MRNGNLYYDWEHIDTKGSGKRHPKYKIKIEELASAIAFLPTTKHSKDRKIHSKFDNKIDLENYFVGKFKGKFFDFHSALRSRDYSYINFEDCEWTNVSVVNKLRRRGSYAFAAKIVDSVFDRLRMELYDFSQSYHNPCKAKMFGILSVKIGTSDGFLNDDEAEDIVQKLISMKL